MDVGWCWQGWGRPTSVLIEWNRHEQDKNLRPTDCSSLFLPGQSVECTLRKLLLQTKQGHHGAEARTGLAQHGKGPHCEERTWRGDRTFGFGCKGIAVCTMTWHFPVITSFILRSQMLSFNSMYKLYISCTNFLSLRMRCRETGCCRCCYARCAVSHNLTRQFGSPMKHMLFASEPGTSQPRPILCASPLKNPALFEWTETESINEKDWESSTEILSKCMQMCGFPKSLVAAHIFSFFGQSSRGPPGRNIAV